MSEQKVVAFQNVNPYPVSLNIAGIRGKVCLWEGQQIKDREGVPLIPPETEWTWLISKGVKPVYLAVEEEKAALAVREEAAREVILDDRKLMEQQATANSQNLVADFLAPKPVVPAEISREEESLSPPVNHLERADNPDPAKGALVWQDKDGVWILNKDGFSSINPAEIKKHIRRDKTLGADFLGILEWRGFGTKTEPAEEEDFQV
jgi:hypothetical protein